MDAFIAAWLDELSAMDALRLCAACRSAREALGADGVAAAAFAVTRPWRANPAGRLRLWRRAWAACSSASSALGLRGGAWLKTATVIPALPVNQDPRETDVGLTLDVASARALGEDGIRMLRRGIATSSPRGPCECHDSRLVIVSFRCVAAQATRIHSSALEED